MKMVIIFAKLLRARDFCAQAYMYWPIEQHSESTTTSVTEGTKGAPVAEYPLAEKRQRQRHIHHWH